MLFSSIPFLFWFLPGVLILYAAAPGSLKNTVLLLSSLCFYGWGEPKYVVWMVVAILMAYIFGLLIERYQSIPKLATAKSMHRLSLNPLHHIDWLGLALMFTVGFGWAKPVPVNPNYFRKPKQGMAVTALAGPVSNLLLAVLFLGIGKVIYLYAPYSAGMNVFFEWCLFTVAPMSVGMGLFNLIPIPPLDGSKVLAMFLPNSAYGQLMRYERYGILVLLALSWLGLGGNFLGNAIYGVYEALFHIFFA